MRSQIPRSGAAHGESSNADAVAIDWILRHHVLDSLQDVEFAVVLVNRTRPTSRGTKHHALSRILFHVPGILFGHSNLIRAGIGGGAWAYHHYQRFRRA